MRLATRLLVPSFAAAVILGSSCSSVRSIGQAQAAERDDRSTKHAQPVKPSDKATEQKEQPSSEDEAWAPRDVERLVQDAVRDLVPLLQSSRIEALVTVMKPGEWVLKARDAKADDERYHVRVCFLELAFLHKYLVGDHSKTDNPFLRTWVEAPMMKAEHIIPDEKERQWMINEALPLVIRQLKSFCSLCHKRTSSEDSQ